MVRFEIVIGTGLDSRAGLGVASRSSALQSFIQLNDCRPAASTLKPLLQHLTIGFGLFRITSVFPGSSTSKDAHRFLFGLSSVR